MDDLDNEIPNIIKKPVERNSSNSASSRSALKSRELARTQVAAQRRLQFGLLGTALVISAVAGYFLYGIMVQKVTENNVQLVIDREINARIKSTSTFLNVNQRKLDELARHPSFVQALTEKNKDAFQILSNSFVKQFEGSLALSIFALGDAQIDRESSVPIRFSELDLIRRAELRQKFSPEAALINNTWQLNFVSPVAVDKEQPVLGTLMLTLNIEELTKEFTSEGGDLGESILQQRFSNAKAQNIILFGTLGSTLSIEKEIPDSNWQVKFTPSDTMLENNLEPPTLWAIVVGCITAFSLFLALGMNRFLVNKQKKSAQELVPKTAGINKTPKATTLEITQNTLFQTQDILDITVVDEDEKILGLHDTSKMKHASATPIVDDGTIPKNIFRSYDIRGVVGTELTPALAQKIGQAVGSEALDQAELSLIVARDARTHSQELTNALIKGILSSGCNVINIGIIPTPVMYFATYHFDDVRSGVMVTASHNPAEYNGFKVVIKNNAIADDAVMELRTRIVAQRIRKGFGEESFREIIPHYIERIFSDVALAGNVSLVIDAGNAVTGIVAPQLFEELGCVVTPLYCDLDGTFPNHDPDPTQEKNLQDLIAKVQEVGADLGVAFDGDGDRLVVVTPKGEIIWPDRLLMLFAKDILARNPGADVLFDVKCSRQLNQVISG